MIKYLGSKRVLVDAITGIIAACPEVKTVLDLFSGTSRVGHALKQRGYFVKANDHNAYAHCLAKCYVQADAKQWCEEANERIIELNQLEGKRGYFTENFCERARFFQPFNGARIDAMREKIAEWHLHSELECILLTSLMEAADRVDSTTGVQMAYLKTWAARSFQPIELRLPRLAAGPGEAYRLDAAEATAHLVADLAYIDPPYNQHSYLGNYHVWESLIRWDKPEVYGVACKRIDVRSRPSDFNSRVKFKQAFSSLLHSVRAPRLLISFSDEGYISRAEMEELLTGLGSFTTMTHDFKRYVGSQIGIYNQKGIKVGKAGHARNQEFLFLVERARIATVP